MNPGLNIEVIYGVLKIEIDWEKIEAKIEMEYQKERERPERPVSTATTAGSRTGGVGGGTRPAVRT